MNVDMVEIPFPKRSLGYNQVKSIAQSELLKRSYSNRSLFSTFVRNEF